MSRTAPGPFETPAAAEAAFYEAVERCDLRALERIWALGEGVVCVHPGIDRAEGRVAVLDSFARMFAGSARLGFEIVDVVASRTERLAVHHARERIRLEGRLAAVMAATNVYVLQGEGWRLLMHHASHEGGSPAAGGGDGPDGDGDDGGGPEPGAPSGRTLH